MLVALCDSKLVVYLFQPMLKRMFVNDGALLARPCTQLTSQRTALEVFVSLLW